MEVESSESLLLSLWSFREASLTLGVVQPLLWLPLPARRRSSRFERAGKSEVGPRTLLSRTRGACAHASWVSPVHIDIRDTHLPMVLSANARPRGSQGAVQTADDNDLLHTKNTDISLINHYC